jgi:hypothetical protein
MIPAAQRRETTVPNIASVVCLTVVLLSVFAAASAETLYVTPDGKDQWSGKIARPNADGTDGPLASLQGARSASSRPPDR